jgi:hypothetical protein
VLCALCSVLCALCSVLCALCSVLCALCSVLCALCSVLSALLLCARFAQDLALCALLLCSLALLCSLRRAKWCYCCRCGAARLRCCDTTILRCCNAMMAVFAAGSPKLVTDDMRKKVEKSLITSKASSRAHNLSKASLLLVR